MNDEIDLVKRDPNEINSHVQVDFPDILAEPDALHSFDCVWRVSYLCFTGGKNCFYKLITTIAGIFIALAWGLVVASITVEQVWISTPLFRIVSIYALCCQKYIGTCCNCCIAPICETFGLLFSKITVTNRSG